MADLNWSDAQWQKVRACVTEAFGKTSVASAFLPMYGPLPGSAETVRNERLKEERDTPGRPPVIRLDADHAAVNLRLVNVTVNVLLSSEQVADETLSDALLAFRRAANIIAQQQDRIVFAGFRGGPKSPDSDYVVNAPKRQVGLADLAARQDFGDLGKDKATIGQALVSAIVKAISTLEDNSHPAPFACVLGNTLFEHAHDPSESSLVLPADRITPLLKGGPLLRSGKMEDDAGFVVSLAGNAVDIVVGTPPSVQFLQRKEDAKFLFRVYERFVLRIRDADKPPVAGFRIQPKPSQTEQEAKELLELAIAEAKIPNLEVKVAELAKKLATARAKRRQN